MFEVTFKRQMMGWGICDRGKVSRRRLIRENGLGSLVRANVPGGVFSLFGVIVCGYSGTEAYISSHLASLSALMLLVG